MSKQSEAKEKQGYIAKPTPTICSNCSNYQSDIEIIHCGWGEPDNTYQKENNIRCGIGKFAIKKTATCKEFTLKEM